MKKLYVIDTNTVFDYPALLERKDVVLTSHVLREIEKIESQKCFGNPDLKHKIREVKRYYDSNEDIFTVDLQDYVWDLNDTYDTSYEDNRILKCCIVNDYGLLTKDRLLRIKARFYNIDVIKPEEEFETNVDSSYTGIKELLLDPNNEEDANVIKNITIDFDEVEIESLKLVQNQYLILWDKSKPTYNDFGVKTGYKAISFHRYEYGELVKVKYKPVSSKFIGEVKPINIKQICAFNMLQNPDITIKALFGGFGVGKDFIMISHAINTVLDPSNPIDRILWVRNNVEVKDTNPIGFLPEGMSEKLLPFAMPLADHLGGIEGLNMFVDKGQVVVEHLGFMRGRNIENAIIYVTECENNTEAHIKLLIGRVGNNSQLWINGDIRQVDDKKFESSNGVTALKKLAGEHLFGVVTLDKIERSDTAKLADKLD